MMTDKQKTLTALTVAGELRKMGHGDLANEVIERELGDRKILLMSPYRGVR